MDAGIAVTATTRVVAVTGDLTKAAGRDDLEASLRHLRIGHLPTLSDVDLMAGAIEVARGMRTGRFAALVGAR